MNSSTPKIKWINHASFLLDYGEIKLVSDPWLEGRVFNNSWELLAKTKFSYEDFNDVTHIWFSHEHPDHFFPPNINQIPEILRNKITVLFQYTDDKKVIDFCRKKGFKEIIELNPFQKYKLCEDFFITNGTVANDTDSWLLLEVGNKIILNLNDCVIRDEMEIKKIRNLYKNLDLLLTQFSYAGWVGNPDQTEKKQKSAEHKRNEMIFYANSFQPKHIIPFASYVWFCSEDNFHMNNEANKIGEICNFILENNFNPVVLYPNDEWIVGEPHNHQIALESYQNDVRNLPERKLTEFETISYEDLQISAIKYIERAKINNNSFRLKRIKPMNIFVKDYEATHTFCFKNGLRINNQIKKEQADIVMCSQNLKYCFDFDWGYDTIQVAGTFEKTTQGKFEHYYAYHWVSRLNNKGGKIHGYFYALLQKLKS